MDMRVRNENAATMTLKNVIALSIGVAREITTAQSTVITYTNVNTVPKVTPSLYPLKKSSISGFWNIPDQTAN